MVVSRFVVVFVGFFVGSFKKNYTPVHTHTHTHTRMVHLLLTWIIGLYMYIFCVLTNHVRRNKLIYIFSSVCVCVKPIILSVHNPCYFLHPWYGLFLM